MTLERTERWLLPALARYFRLELAGTLPDWQREPSVFVMNHTAILGLEVYLLYAALRRVQPDAPRPVTTVWPPFLDMPVLGAFYRASNCIPMSVEGAVRALRGGESVLILPEGPDATDVRARVGPFHTGFLRVVREANVPLIPLGWAGVDEANPWWVTTHPLLVRTLMHPFMPRFDFALIPRPPMLRPSKVVFVAGEPLRFGAHDLESEERLLAEVARVRSVVESLVEKAEALREERIAGSLAERMLHRATFSHHVRWRRS
jgi:1-acyl-sn-glycerol-3-phosphate acyltransferase